MTSDEVGLIGLDTVGAVGPAMVTNLAEAGVLVVAPRHKPGYRRARRAFQDATVLGLANGVAERARSLGAVRGYGVKGHVRAGLVERLLRERPTVVGVLVPGIPVGSPGMEVPGGRVDRHQVLTFDRSGRTGMFATR
jgi:hypothetical protein